MPRKDAFSTKNLHLEGPVAKTLKSGFLRRAEIRTESRTRERHVRPGAFDPVYLALTIPHGACSPPARCLTAVSRQPIVRVGQTSYKDAYLAGQIVSDARFASQ